LGQDSVSLGPVAGTAELRQHLLRVAARAREVDRSTRVHERSLDIAAGFSDQRTVRTCRRLEIVRRAGLALGDEASLPFERLIPSATDEIHRRALVTQPAHAGGVPEAFGDLQALGAELTCAMQV